MDHGHLLLRCCLALLIASAALADHGQSEHPASFVERAIGHTTAAFNTRWDQLRAWAKLTLQSTTSTSRSESSRGQVAKEAAAKSFEVSKEAVAETARTAADATGEAVDWTKEKVKRTVSKARGDNDEAEL